MLMKVISLVMSFVMGRAAQPRDTQTSFLLNMATMATLRRIGMVSAGAVAGIVIFLGGFFTILIDMILSTRAADQLAFSQASLVGFALIIISFLLELVLFSKGNWEPIVVHQEEAEGQAKNQPIADALADLIRDYTMERRAAREQRSEQMSTTSATSAAASPAYN